MNLGSKLNRVKLQADRLFLRGDKTDVIGELRYAEEQAEELRLLCEAFARSLEKRHKKLPENQVAEILKEALKEVSQNQPDDANEKSLLKVTFEEIVAVEQFLGKECLDYEDTVEAEILAPFHKLLKDDLSSVAKQKKALKQAGQDVDAAKAKVRSSHGNLSQPNKIESYKEELEDVESKLDQMKDSYACELFNVLGKQREIVRICNLYLEMKVDYLQKSLQRLNNVLPPIRRILDDSTCSPMYGVPLYEHLRITQQEIAVPIQICVRRLVEFGMYEEGLLRIAGSSTKIRRLKGLFDAGLISLETGLEDASRDTDIHVVAGAFKGYLRELPEPLLTNTKHDQLVEAVRHPDHKEKLQHMWQVVNTLPTPNYNNLRYVVKFLTMLASFAQENKMTPNNIAIVMAPTLVGGQRDHDSTELASLGRNMTLGTDYRVAVELLIEYFDYFFKDNVDFGIIPRHFEPPPSPKMETHATLTSNGAHLIRTGSHRRTGSSDFANPFSASQQQQASSQLSSSTSSLVFPESESPKQPHRQKKKPAPLPPQSETSIPASLSPEISRGKSPPTHALITSNTAVSSTTATSVFPSPRFLQHSNSIRRPSAEPPKPPGGTGPPPKPPRPTPPSLPTDEESEAKIAKPPRPSLPCRDAKEEEPITVPDVAIGFENVLGQNPTNLQMQSDMEAPLNVLTNNLNEKEPESNAEPVIGFVTGTIRKLTQSPNNLDGTISQPSAKLELRQAGGGVPDQNFRKSLEGALKNQPQAYTRHLIKLSDSQIEQPSENKAPVVLPPFPVPVQRSSKEKPPTEKPEPAPRLERPAIPEKPSTINRSAIPPDHLCSLIQDRQVIVASKSSATPINQNEKLAGAAQATSGCEDSIDKTDAPSIQVAVPPAAANCQQNSSCTNEETKAVVHTLIPPELKPPKPSDSTHL